MVDGALGLHPTVRPGAQALAPTLVLAVCCVPKGANSVLSCAHLIVRVGASSRSISTCNFPEQSQPALGTYLSGVPSAS